MTKTEIVEQIKIAKKEKNAVILAHTYQNPDIIDIADVTGDSYALSLAAEKLGEKRVVMCGVRFMAETVKILSPEKDVVLASEGATCAMAEQITPDRVLKFKKENPDVCVVAYINTTTALKAVCDVCVTSSTAVKIVNAIENKDILFIPDKNLGAHVKAQCPDKNIILWDGYCPVHNQITAQDVIDAKNQYPEATVAMHPECPAEALKLADMIGATSNIIDYCKSCSNPVIIATERGVCDYLSLKNPDKKYYQLAADKLVCPDMKMTSLEDVLAAINGEGGEEIVLTEEVRLGAKGCIDNMIKYSK
ncbi:MAG: quinolinate synthase NadA [Clostridia bacterium]|nr:quinolinate synthase NadA [Clostridia bacterium]